MSIRGAFTTAVYCIQLHLRLHDAIYLLYYSSAMTNHVTSSTSTWHATDRHQRAWRGQLLMQRDRLVPCLDEQLQSCWWCCHRSCSWLQRCWWYRWWWWRCHGLVLLLLVGAWLRVEEDGSAEVNEGKCRFSTQKPNIYTES
jgi:hypothetical protein